MPPAILAVGAIGAGIAAHKAATARDRKGGPPPGTTRTFQDPTLTDTGYDPNKLEYGGRSGQADADAGWWRERQRENSFKADNLYNQANDDRNLSLQARGGQVQAANLMLDRAQGKNLVSDRMAGTARRDLTSRMRSGAASAMGPAALANAQSDALAAEAQGLGQINDAATTQAIQEKTAAEQAAFGAQTGIREGDLGSRNAGLQSGLGFGNLGAQYGQLENQVRANQNQVNLGGQQMLNQSKMHSDTLNVDTYNKGKQRDTEGLKMGLGAVTSLAQVGAAASDPLAKSGIETLGATQSGIAGPEGVTGETAQGGADLPSNPYGSDPKKSQKAPGQQKPLDMSWTSMSPVDATPRPDLSMPRALPQDATNIPITSDPKAKQEAFLMGVQYSDRISGGDTKVKPPSFMKGSDLDSTKVSLEDPKPVPPTSMTQDYVPQRFDQTRTWQARFDEPVPTVPATPPAPAQPSTVDRFLNAAAGIGNRIIRPSDPRAKDLGGVHANEVADTLDKTPAVSYKYKDESFEPEAQRPGERQAGFLTSDLKKTPLGAAVVEERPDGLEGYNEHRLNGLQHAEIRNLHERLRDIEAMADRLGLIGGRRG